MPLDNCKRCKRLFQKTTNPYCKECHTQEQSLIMDMYHYIHENPGIALDALAETFDLPVREVENLLFSGALGTANQLVRTQCALCKCEMTYVNRIGYFCYSCNNFVEKEAGVGKFTEADRRIENIMKGHSAFYKPLSDEEERMYEHFKGQQKPKAAEPEAPPPSSRNAGRFGFKRMSGGSSTRHSP